VPSRFVRSRRVGAGGVLVNAQQPHVRRILQSSRSVYEGANRRAPPRAHAFPRCQAKAESPHARTRPPKTCRRRQRWRRPTMRERAASPVKRLQTEIQCPATRSSTTNHPVNEQAEDSGAGIARPVVELRAEGRGECRSASRHGVENNARVPGVIQRQPSCGAAGAERRRCARRRPQQELRNQKMKECRENVA